MKYRMDEMSYLEFEERRKTVKTVIIPTGAVEVYGPHLPMGADGIAAMAVSQRVAKRTDALIAPMINVGESSALTCFPGTMTLKRETYQTVMDECFLQLIRYGFRNFLFLTGHAGNVDAISYLARKYQTEYKIKCGQIDWWRFANANGGEVFELEGYMAHGHASECGTSVMMYLRPELVQMERATRVEPEKEIYTSFPDVIRYLPFDSKTENGIIGDATIGTPEKGRRIVETCVNRIVTYMEHEF